MIFTPNYNVVYHGDFYAAGKPFEIDADDAEEMKQHGTVTGRARQSKQPEEAAETAAAKTATSETAAARKPGRPKKAVTAE